jgi:hypothetical protein
MSQYFVHGNGTGLAKIQVSSLPSTSCLLNLVYKFLFWYGMVEEIPQVGS